MGRRMAAGVEARPFRKPPRVAAVPDAREVDLRVAAQAQVVVPRLQHFRMDRAVDLMAAAASFPEGLMVEHERPALVLMALEAGLVDALDAGCGPRPDVRGVRVVAIRAAHFPFHDRVVVWQTELGSFVEMTLKTRAGVLPRIDAAAPPPAAAGLHVEAARSMARLTALGHADVAGNGDAGVRRVPKFLLLLGMTGRTGFGADVCGLGRGWLGRGRFGVRRFGGAGRIRRQGPG